MSACRCLQVSRSGWICLCALEHWSAQGHGRVEEHYCIVVLVHAPARSMTVFVYPTACWRGFQSTLICGTACIRLLPRPADLGAPPQTPPSTSSGITWCLVLEFCNAFSSNIGCSPLYAQDRPISAGSSIKILIKTPCPFLQLMPQSLLCRLLAPGGACCHTGYYLRTVPQQRPSTPHLQDQLTLPCHLPSQWPPHHRLVYRMQGLPAGSSALCLNISHHSVPLPPRLGIRRCS
jgi:hypothetical protein